MFKISLPVVLSVILMLICNVIWCQTNAVISEIPTSINTSGAAPHPSAMLDISSNTKGIRIPRMSFNAMQNIKNPQTGLTIFCIDDGCLYHYGNLTWRPNCAFEYIADESIGPNDTKIKAANGMGQANYINSNRLSDSLNEYTVLDVYFSSYDDVTQIMNYVNSDNGELTINFKKDLDPSNSFNDSTFTAPVRGLYKLSANLSFDNGTGPNDDTVFLSFYKNGVQEELSTTIDPLFFATNVIITESLHGIMLLEKGDQVSVRINGIHNGGESVEIIDRSYSGQLISR